MKKTALLLSLFVFFTLTMHTLQAQNGYEPAFRKWALTPPMGWNSWDCYGPSVVEKEVLQNAVYMGEHLKDYGWHYVVVDIRWFVDNQKTGSYIQNGTQQYTLDEYGRYYPGETRFPSSVNGKGFKPLADSIHALGLKFGIHIMRGVPRIAVTQKCPIKETSYTCNQIYKTDSLCTWLSDNYSIDCRKPGAQEYYNSIFNLYAEWGVDFIKIDDLSRPYHDGEIALIRNAIDQCGRPMILSMSPGATPLGKAESCQNHANMWRMMDDYWDLWSDLENEFTLCNNWAPYYQPGSYPDCDMLPLGMFLRGERASNRWTRFTENEQRTMMTLFGIFHSPFFFGGDLTYNDEWTNSLLTNEEMLYMHAYGVNAHQVSNQDSRVIWSSEDPATGNRYAALFNIASSSNWIYSDKALYRTETISPLTDGFGQQIEVDIPEGSTMLALVTDDAGDNNNYDHGDWISPTIIFEDGSEALLDIKDTIRTQVKNSYYKYIRVNTNIMSSGKLNVKGTAYDNGFAMHANAMMLFKLPTDKKAVRFKAFAGIDQTSTSQNGASPTLKFMVYNCDPTTRTLCNPFESKANSGFVSRTQQPEGVNLTADITGATKLYLVVTDGDDNFSYDHANWVNPMLIDADGNQTSLTDYNYTSAVTDWQNLAVKNKNVDGGTLNINGKSYSKGIGTNSNAVIIYDLPADKHFVTFTALVGYDYAMKSAPFGVTMEFLVFTENPLPDYSRTVNLDLTALGIDADHPCALYDIWEGKEIGIFKNNEFTDTLSQHASSLYRVTPLERSSTNGVSLESLALAPDSVLVTATVSGEVDESSYVQFLCDNVIVGCIKVENGTSVSYLATGLPTGKYVFQAKYSGTKSTAAAVSNNLEVNMEPSVGINVASSRSQPLIQVKDSQLVVSSQIVSYTLYNLNGQIQVDCFQGIYIAKMVLIDGSMRVQKIII